VQAYGLAIGTATAPYSSYLMALVVLALGGVIWLVRLPQHRHGGVVGGAVPN